MRAGHVNAFGGNVGTPRSHAMHWQLCDKLATVSARLIRVGSRRVEKLACNDRGATSGERFDLARDFEFILLDRVRGKRESSSKPDQTSSIGE